MASSQARRQADRDRAGEVAVREVADEVVLRHDEGLPAAVLELAVQLQHHRSARERQLARIRVRNLDHLTRATRIAVTEPTAIPPRRDVRDDVELLSRVEQCLLEREVVARRDDERMR